MIVSRPISHKWEEVPVGLGGGSSGNVWLFLAKETDFAVMLLLFSFSYFHALNIDSNVWRHGSTFYLEEGKRKRIRGLWWHC